MRLTRSRLHPSGVLLGTALIVAACGGGGSSSNTTGDSSGTGDSLDLQSSGALPTTTGSGTMYVDLRARAHSSYGGETEPADITLTDSGPIIDRLLFGSDRRAVHDAVRLEDAPLVTLRLRGGPLDPVIEYLTANSPRPPEGFDSVGVVDPVDASFDVESPFMNGGIVDLAFACRDGSSQRVDGPVETLDDGTRRWERTIEFDRCAHVRQTERGPIDSVYDGTLRWTVESVDGVPSGTWIGFDSFRVTQASTTHRLDGVDALPHAAQCSPDEARTLDLLVSNETSGETVLYEGMRTALLGIEPRYCAGIRREANWFSGLVRHSTHGTFEVATQVHVASLGDGRSGYAPIGGTLDPADPTRSLDGAITLTGADGVSVSVRFDGDVARMDGDQAATVTLQIRGGDADGDSVRLNRDDAELGVFRALVDGDLDGLPDGWERLRGLDASDPTDAGTILEGGAARFLFAASASAIDPDRRTGVVERGLRKTVPAYALGTGEETRTLEATFEVTERLDPLNVAVEIAVPDGVLIEGARFTADGSQSLRDRCTVNRVIRCDMESLGLGDIATLALDYRVTSGTASELEWTIDASDADVIVAPSVTRMARARPVSVLQALVDAANDGDTVQLPSGRFVGTLDGRGKRLRLEGSPDTDGTSLVSDDTFESALTGPGSGSLIDGIRFEIAGPGIWAPNASRLDIVDSTFMPVDGIPHVMKQLIVGQGRLRFENNLVQGFGERHGGECQRLLVSNSQNGHYYSGNRFIDNACGSVIEISNGSWRFEQEDQRLDILHNTFFENDVVLSLQAYSQFSFPVLFANNVIVGSEWLIAGPEWTNFTFRLGSFTTDSNLLFDSERESVLSGMLVQQAGVGYRNLDTTYDPLFVDAVEGDLRLSAGSPAIDAAADVPAWVPGSGPAFPYDGTAAIDGDGDGLARRDIGALEHRP